MSTNIEVLVSGGGTNLQALIDAQARGDLGGGKITAVISSKAGAYALERAAKAGIPGFVLPRKEFSSNQAMTLALVEKLKSGELDVILGNMLCENALSKEAFLSRPMFESCNYLVADKEIAAKYPDGDAVAMLQNECLVTNCEDTGPNSMEMLQEMLRREFGVVPERVSQTNSTNAQLLMVRARHGVAIVPDLLHDEREDNLVRIKMNMGDMTRYDMIRLAANSNPAAQLLMDFQ